MNLLETVKENLIKGGPYIGPRGGKWADPKHSIPYIESKKRTKKVKGQLLGSFPVSGGLETAKKQISRFYGGSTVTLAQESENVWSVSTGKGILSTKLVKEKNRLRFIIPEEKKAPEKKGIKLPPHLKELADKMDQQGFKVTDVTPGGYGPDDPESKFDGPTKDKDAVSGSAKADRKIVTLLNKLHEMARIAMKAGKKAPDFDLCEVSVPGTNLFCGGNKEIPRAEMPQLKGKAVKGSRADKELNPGPGGEVDAEGLFKKELKARGIKLTAKKVPADSLKATQNELVGVKVAGMMDALKSNPNHEKITAPIFISKDGYILDGHHRWAAMVGIQLARDSKEPMQMDVVQVDLGAEELVDFTNKFSNEVGIAQKEAKVEGIRKYLLYQAVRGELMKRGPFIGPRGGKWKDPKHTISYEEESGRGGKQNVVFEREYKAKRPILPFKRKLRETGRYHTLISDMKSDEIFAGTFIEFSGKDGDEFLERVENKGAGNGRQIGVTVDEVGHSLTNGIIAFVSAGKNPNLESKMTKKEELVRAEKLYGDLVKSGYAFTPVAGKYEGNVEDTFLVLIHDANQDYVKKLGEQYNQDSILYSDEGNASLWYTTGKNKGKRDTGEGHTLLSGETADDYTLVPTTDNGFVKFRMNIDFSRKLRKMIRSAVLDRTNDLY